MQVLLAHPGGPYFVNKDDGHWSIPKGEPGPDEDLFLTAQREFEEETGYYPRHIQPLGYYNQFPGTLRAATNLFFASDLQPTQQKLDEGEFLEIVRLPVADVLQMVLRGEVIDGSLQLGACSLTKKGC